MSRVAILKIGPGSFEQGFAVSLQLREDHGAPIAELEGQLPANLEIESLYLCWQQAFRSLTVRDRSGIVSAIEEDWELDQSRVTHRSTREDVEACRQFAKALEASMKHWLKASRLEGWQRIRERLAKELANYPDRLRVMIQTRESQLWKLPWQAWDLFSEYPAVGIGYSLPDFEQPAPRAMASRVSKQVRILAVLGNNYALDLQPDEEVIQQLEQTDAVFLHQPTAQALIRHLRDDRGWDIFFFAGHSQTEQQTGRIYLNDLESLEIDQFRNALGEALRKGLKIAIFNSCDGLGLAQRLANLQVPAVICMREKVPDQVAQSFLKEFLIEYAKDETLYTAVRRSQERLEEFQDLPGSTWLPMIYQNPAEVPPTWQSLRGKILDLPVAPPLILPRIKFRFVLLTTVLVTGMLLWVRSQGHLQSWELQAFDQLMRRQPTEPIDPRILIVSADEEDLQHYGYPLPDGILSQVLQRLKPAKPAAIGIDIVRDQPVNPGHDRLMSQFQGDPNAIAICAIGNTRESSIAPPSKVSTPQIGFVDLYSDESQTSNQDYTIRRYLLSRSANPVSTPSRCPTAYSFALQLVARYFELKKIPIAVQSEQWQFGSTRVKRLASDSGGYQNLDERGNQSMIRYRHTPDPRQIAQQVRLRDVLSHDFDLESATGRIVLIGVMAPSVPDIHSTPYGRVRGLHVHAHMISQLLSAVEDQRRLIDWLPVWGNGIWLFGWSMAGGLGGWRFRRYGQHFLALGLGIGILYGCCWIALLQGLWLPLIPPLIALVLTGGTVAIAHKITQSKTIRLIRGLI